MIGEVFILTSLTSLFHLLRSSDVARCASRIQNNLEIYLRVASNSWNILRCWSSGWLGVPYPVPF